MDLCDTYQCESYLNIGYYDGGIVISANQRMIDTASLKISSPKNKTFSTMLTS